MTKSFFESVMKLPTVSGREDMVVDFLRRWAKGNRCRFRRDSAGNVILTKGSAQFMPAIACHIDCVHRDQEEMVAKGVFKELEWKGDVVTAKNPITGKQTGLGADDLCGLAVALAVLQKLPSGKVLATVKEELGCVGAKSVDSKFFDDASFVVGTDSPESNRATRYSDGVLLCGDGFFDEYVKPVCAKHGVTSFRSEPLCDCAVYRKINLGEGKRIECFNVGSGGYNPHQNTEYAKFSEVCNCEDLVLDLCRTVPSDRRWTSDYKEEERPKPWWQTAQQTSSRFDVYSQWRGRSSGSSYMPQKQAEFDFSPSAGDRSFLWIFRGGEPAANLYVDRVGGLLAPSVRIEKSSADSVRVTGPEAKLKTAFRFAYNYDNGTRFMNWEEFAKAVPAVEKEFERALSEFDRREKERGEEMSPMEHSDSDQCSIELTFSDDSVIPEYLKALADAKIEADPVEDEALGNVSLQGTLGDLKRAYVVWWNFEEGTSYRDWGNFSQSEPVYADSFWDDVAFDDDWPEDDEDVIDADFEEISEAGGWLDRYRSGDPL